MAAAQERSCVTVHVNINNNACMQPAGRVASVRKTHSIHVWSSRPYAYYIVQICDPAKPIASRNPGRLKVTPMRTSLRYTVLVCEPARPIAELDPADFLRAFFDIITGTTPICRVVLVLHAQASLRSLCGMDTGRRASQRPKPRELHVCER